jgi:hypothetical protein
MYLWSSNGKEEMGVGMSEEAVVEFSVPLAEEMTESEFKRVLVIVADKLRWIIDQDLFPDMELDQISHTRFLTDEHIMKTQAMLLNELCLKIDELRGKNRRLKTECRRLSNELGWLRSPMYQPGGVKINA